jgi:hypothetical protein
MKKIAVLLGVIAFTIGCAQPENSAQPAPDNNDNPQADAPWRNAALASSQVPPVYYTVWNRAENRATCAPVAFASTGEEQATPRAATFSGGWGVAYDLPRLRSAFGIAGAGVNASDSTYSAWPHNRSWADGSSVGYGPEGGTGPNQLAYLRIAGQECLYNVWSRLGNEHLESLIEAIRFIEQNRQ